MMETSGGPAVENQPTKRYRYCPHWSYCLLVFIIITVSVAFSLVLLPHILTDYDSLTATDPLSCSPVPYHGSLCVDELQNWQSCLPERQNVTKEVLIPSSIDQDLAESQVSMLFAGLQFVQTSEVCQQEFREFWCLLLFRVCDGDGKTRAPSYELCNTLQTDTCLDLYQLAVTVPEFSIIIQNCNNFRLATPPPCGEGIDLGSSSEKLQFNVSCSSGFFYDETTLICKPKCGEWSPLSPSAHTTATSILIASDIVSVLICISILVLSIIQYKQIFAFPLILIIYSTVIVLVVVLLDFVNFLPFPSLLCKSDDLLNILSDSRSNTVFCQFQGIGIISSCHAWLMTSVISELSNIGGLAYTTRMLFLYASLVISFFWVFQTAVYFWVVLYPIQFNSYKLSGKLKIIHIVSVIIGVTIPAVPILAINLGEGFGLSIFVPYKCIPLDAIIFSYSFSITIVIVIICGISLLINTLWLIGRVMSRLQGKQTARQGKKLSTAELKLILILIAYMIVALHSTLSSNITLSHVNTHSTVLGDYFACESLGDATVECSREEFQMLERDSLVQTFVYAVFNIYPAIFFIFLVSPRMFVDCCRKKKSQPTTSQTPTNSQG